MNVIEIGGRKFSKHGTGRHCENCEGDLHPIHRVVCPDCFSKLPEEFRDEWKQATSEKGWNAVIRKVRRYLKRGKR